MDVHLLREEGAHITAAIQRETWPAALGVRTSLRDFQGSSWEKIYRNSPSHDLSQRLPGPGLGDKKQTKCWLPKHILPSFEDSIYCLLCLLLHVIRTPQSFTTSFSDTTERDLEIWPSLTTPSPRFLFFIFIAESSIGR
jgi:hypothetical protein